MQSATAQCAINEDARHDYKKTYRRREEMKASLRNNISLLLWGEVDIAVTSTAVRHGEIEGREAQSPALRVDMIGSLYTRP